ncbi:MAG: hypothetical protein JNG90_03780, partial [Planctomycetaceae bacterium]|nr:hypothetical protein [Planctomycetaceae bacterium]
MFRLAETIKELEAENSSRLMLGLKFAREELILLQMQQTKQLLKGLKLGEAVTEEKQLLAKLERLHELLLSNDLDFQLKLERLRLMREILRQLEVAIKEEDREQQLSAQAAADARTRERLTKQATSLAELIRRQQGHLADTERLAGPVDSDAKSSAAPGDTPNASGSAENASPTPDGVAQAQQETRDATKLLAAEQAAAGTKPEELPAAEAQMTQAAEQLEAEKLSAALTPERAALAALEREAQKTADELAALEQNLDPQRFAGLKQEQQGNRQLTERISESVRKLGESGARAMGELIRAGGSMSSAEGSLGQLAADVASSDQAEALAALKLARDELRREADELLAQLGPEIRKRVIEAVTIMLEKQIAVREATQTLVPQVEKGSRQAVASVVGLGKAEGRIVDVANEILSLVEETEFGIALPAALRSVKRSMTGVQAVLTEGQATAEVVAAEQQIESDLNALLEAMKQLPSSQPPKSNNQKGSPQERERELNRLIAELKMIRILQVRVNDDTVQVDAQRGVEAAALAAKLRQEIEAIEEHQDEVREATERLSLERADELQP